MTEDSEVKAMQEVVEALKPLEEDERKRVLCWAVSRYGVESPRSFSDTGRQDADEDLEFQDVASLYDAAAPKTDAKRALVVGYWFQECLGQQDFDAQPVNTALKNLGQGVTNITRALNDLADSKPSLAMQVKKGGKTKQARKRYRLTAAGIQVVKRMLVERNAGEG